MLSQASFILTVSVSRVLVNKLIQLTDSACALLVELRSPDFIPVSHSKEAYLPGLNLTLCCCSQQTTYAVGYLELFFIFLGLLPAFEKLFLFLFL